MFFLESPWPILIVGLVAEALLAVALFRTGRGKLLWPIGGVALLVLLGLVAERYTVTDTKLVRQTLDAAAAGLVANDKDRVKACIVPDPDGDPTRSDRRGVSISCRFPSDFDQRSGREIQRSDEPAYCRCDVYGLRYGQSAWPGFHRNRRDYQAGEHEDQIAEALRSLAGLRPARA